MAESQRSGGKIFVVVVDLFGGGLVGHTRWFVLLKSSPFWIAPIDNGLPFNFDMIAGAEEQRCDSLNAQAAVIGGGDTA
jgi:hypothetical protein